MWFLCPAIPLALEMFSRIVYVLEQTTILSSFKTTSRIFFHFFPLKYVKFEKTLIRITVTFTQYTMNKASCSWDKLTLYCDFSLQKEVLYVYTYVCCLHEGQYDKYECMCS